MIIGLQQELVVIDRNPENAEPGNPEGASYGKIWRATAITNNGEIYVHFYGWKDEIHANAFVQRINETLNDPSDTGGITMNYWTWDRLAYGSKAYQEQGGEQELIRFEMEQEGRQ